MKIKFIFLIISIFPFLNAQTYNFDKLITTELKGKTGILISTHQRLVNSGNEMYYLSFPSKNMAELWDLTQQQLHFFNYSKIMDEMVFKYLYTCDNAKVEKENIEKELSKWDFRAEKISDTEFVLGRYKSKKSKKPTFSIRIFFEESDKNQLHYLGYIKPFYEKVLMKLMNASKNYIIKKMTFYPDGKEAKTLELVYINDNNLEIKLPERLNYKCENKFYK